MIKLLMIFMIIAPLICAISDLTKRSDKSQERIEIIKPGKTGKHSIVRMDSLSRAAPDSAKGREK